ncbi:MAG TPA: hypothetical protein GXX54_02295 [Clostridiales bacterium]|nr:hypothetical protein [Clostridiales bacterium]
MGLKEVKLVMDAGIYAGAEEILNELGLDVNTYVRMALVKLTKERRIPFELSASANQPPAVYPANKGETFNNETSDNWKVERKLNKITSGMCSFLWDEFKLHYNTDDSSFQETARYISEKTGMNRGSAFIYLNILWNLTKGELNKRNMKFEDLEFFINKIREELPEHALKSTIISLEKSIPYWEERISGYFAKKVGFLLESLKKN